MQTAKLHLHPSRVFFGFSSSVLSTLWFISGQEAKMNVFCIKNEIPCTIDQYWKVWRNKKTIERLYAEALNGRSIFMLSQFDKPAFERVSVDAMDDPSLQKYLGDSWRGPLSFSVTENFGGGENCLISSYEAIWDGRRPERRIQVQKTTRLAPCNVGVVRTVECTVQYSFMGGYDRTKEAELEKILQTDEELIAAFLIRIHSV